MAISNEPTRSAPDGVEADLLAVPGGVRPVLWRAAATDGVLTPSLVRRLLDEQTRPGDIVIDVDDDVLFAAATAQAGRRHYALGGVTRLAACGEAAGSADLLLLRWPRHQTSPQWLLVACRSLLRVGSGVLVAVTVPAARRTAHLSALVGAAHAAGLRNVRHIAVAAPDADHAAPAVPHTGAADVGGGGHTPPGVGRVTPHADLLVFAAQVVSR